MTDVVDSCPFTQPYSGILKSTLQAAAAGLINHFAARVDMDHLHVLLTGWHFCLQKMCPKVDKERWKKRSCSRKIGHCHSSLTLDHLAAHAEEGNEGGDENAFVQSQAFPWRRVLCGPWLCFPFNVGCLQRFQEKKRELN